MEVDSVEKETLKYVLSFTTGLYQYKKLPTCDWNIKLCHFFAKLEVSF